MRVGWHIHRGDRVTIERRRLIAVAVIATTLGVPAATFLLDWRLLSGRYVIIAYALVVTGALFSILNGYLSLVRPALHYRSGRPNDEYRHISGAPMVGMLALVGLLFAPPSAVLSTTVLLLVLIDRGNALWFVIATWE